MLYGPGATVAGVFNDTSSTKTNAMTSITSLTLLAFLRPGRVSTSKSGVNGGNLALLFHESLHGFGGSLGGSSYFDQDLKSTFGLKSGKGSDDITKHIKKNCF